MSVNLEGPEDQTRETALCSRCSVTCCELPTMRRALRSEDDIAITKELFLLVVQERSVQVHMVETCSGAGNMI